MSVPVLPQPLTFRGIVHRPVLLDPVLYSWLVILFAQPGVQVIVGTWKPGYLKVQLGWDERTFHRAARQPKTVPPAVEANLPDWVAEWGGFKQNWWGPCRLVFYHAGRFKIVYPRRLLMGLKDQWLVWR